MLDLITCHSPQKGVMTITLNRAEKHNAFNAALIEQLHAALVNVAKNKKIAVVILTAAGKSFCAGADLTEMKNAIHQSVDDNTASAKHIADLLQQLYHLPQATIAVVHGPCYGGGVGLVSACDMAVASTAAQFKLSEVRLGLIPAVISPYVIKAIGEKALRRYALTAETLHAEHAQTLGLVQTALPPGELAAHVQQLTDALLQNGPRAITACKQLIDTIADTPLDDKLIAKTIQSIADIRITDEAQEGLNAFFEKRAPNWQTR